MSGLQRAFGLLVALALLVLAAVVWTGHAREAGRQEGREEVRLAYAAQAGKADTQRAAAGVPIAQQQEARQAQVRTVFKTITKEIPTYVQADACPLPAGFRVLHDAAAYGVVPDPAGVPDAAPVAAQDAAVTVTDNYEIAHATAERLAGLQAWIRAQQELKP